MWLLLLRQPKLFESHSNNVYSHRNGFSSHGAANRGKLSCMPRRSLHLLQALQ